MATPKLTELWNKVQQYGFDVRQNKLDGQKMWEQIQTPLNINKIEGKWDLILIGAYSHMKSKLGVKEVKCEILESDKVKQHDVWEKLHFYLQHTRVPVLKFNEPILCRLMQVAYNSGQLKAEYEDSIYTDAMKEYYDKLKLNKMETYMDEESLQNFEKSIDEEFIRNVELAMKMNIIKGGNYKLKYYKYKTKYNEAKKNKNKK